MNINRSYYVISPNVWNDKNQGEFLKIMFDKHIILMGWESTKKFGKIFNEIQKGDRVIVAQGANKQKKQFFIGEIDSYSEPYTSSLGEVAQCRKLRYFIDIRETIKMPFDEECAYGSSSQIPAIYQLKESNVADLKIIAEINSLINNNKKEQKHNNLINLLKKNYNLILTGGPGTGKTYLAKQIASQMILGKPFTEDFSPEDNSIFVQHCKFVQFHPSYDYTDFVEGLRPTQPDKNGNIGFKRKDGVFKEFCSRGIHNSCILDSKNVFDNVYQIIYNEISKGVITKISNPQYGSFDVEIIDGQIRFGGSKRTESKGNLKILFEYFLKNEVFDISAYRREDYFQLISQLTNGKTNTIDYAYYFGILQEMLKRTEKKYTEDKLPFIFIIDEVNRGEISKIFGELFFSIDPGYRGVKGCVQTQYQNLIQKDDFFFEGFYVPENVFIIGTMNDIDRSVESMDFAMRRRFAWKEIKANESTGMLDEFGELKDIIVQKMTRLNNAIWNEEAHEGIDGLNYAYHIGGAYFKKLNLYLNVEKSNLEEAYTSLWENHLRGLLFEYLRGTSNSSENLKILENAYDGTN